jgi:hypothetical protein
MLLFNIGGIMMKVNHKQMYLQLRQQVRALEMQLNPPAEKVNAIPENFNQVGWDTTIEKLEILIEKMKQLREIKGKRLTPQFYRSIYNRALIGMNEVDKLQEKLSVDVDNIDFEAENKKMIAKLHELHKQVEAKEAKESASR